ncbi:unnamed protein product [Ectocarpus sp. CCAP 1310/34]|nr:unnamed protein product [Ectocarpus sp. CCAP 1310/34]
MVKRRRSSGSPASADPGAAENSSTSCSQSPDQPPATAVEEATNAKHRQGCEDVKEVEEEGHDTPAGAGQEGGEAGEKRRRKRTRTRKKKKGGGGGGEGADEEGEGEDAAAGGGGGGVVGGGGGGGTIADTVYVEGIPWTCDESDVREFFKGCGKITDVRMPRWQDSGRPRGYAHVAFAGSSGAQAAFGRDGQYLNGRYLTVQAPQEPATEKARRANRKAEQPAGCRTVFVKNLPYDVEEDAVSEALAGCGRIASVRLAMWNHTRKLKGFGYVEFSTERGAETCVRTQQSLSIGGRPLVVDFETGAPKGSFRRQDGAQIKKTSADAGVGKGKAPKFKVHL